MLISPMLLQYALNNQPFDKDNHIAELKFDGIRLIASYLDEMKLYTKQHNDVTNKFPELVNPSVPIGTILDGELAVLDSDGKPDFESMMSRFHSRKSHIKVVYIVFDIIMYNHVDVTKLPLHERKELLTRAFEDTEYYTKVKQAKGLATDYFEVIKKAGLEGIVIKDLNSKYMPGTRSWAWQKVINWIETDVFITGHRKADFGWLTSRIDAEGHLRPSGIVEFGVSSEQKRAFRLISKQLIYKEDKKFVYVEPKIRIKVKTRNWTSNGMLRSPVFIEFML